MDEEDFSDVLAVRAVARPTRVAFILDRADVQLGEVDELAYRCSTYWGGGFWPIVLSDGQSISADWWNLLVAVDPDVIYCVPTLSEELEDRILRHIAPARIVTHARREDEPALHFSLAEVDAVDSFEALAFNARRTVFREPRFLAIEDAREEGPDRAFVVRNLGLFRPSVQSQAMERTVPIQKRSVGTLSKFDALNWMLEFPGSAVCPKDLGTVAAPRPFGSEYRHPFAGFTLVVGDSVDEALCAWNRSLVSTGYQGRDVLWIDSASARDQEFLALFAKWVQRFYWDSQQLKRGIVVSYSEDIQFLKALAEGLRKPTWMYWEGLRLSAGDFPTAISQSAGVNFPDSRDAEGRTVERVAITARGNFDRPSGLVSVPRPPFVESRAAEAGWMVDLDIEYALDRRRFANTSDRWRLPRIAHLAQLFARERRLARIEKSHRPSVSVRSRERSLELRIPSKWQVLRDLLQPVESRRRPVNKSTGLPPSRFGDFRTSEQGRRLRGLVGLLGGVQGAGRLFDETFWRTVLLRAVGKPADEAETLAAIVRREVAPLFESFAKLPIERTVGERLSELGFDDVARTVGTAVHKAKAQPETITRSQLEQTFGRLTTEVIDDGAGQRKLRFGDGAVHTFEWLVESGVLQQGIVLKCPECGTKQWRRVNDLDRVLRCEDCTSQFALPSGPAWEFRVNGLIANAISRNGVLPVVHATWKLTDWAREMVLTIPPQELREREDGPVVTDLDIVIIRDGEFVLGEVKSSPKAFDAAQLTTLESVVREIRPNRFVFAAPGTAWPADVKARIDAFAAAMDPLDVTVEAMLLSW